MVSHVSLGDVSNPIELSQDKPRGSQVATQTMIHNIYKLLTMNAEIYPVLHPYLLVDLKYIWGKQTKLIARDVAMLHAKSTTTSFPKKGGDNTLKRHRSFFETSHPKN